MWQQNTFMKIIKLNLIKNVIKFEILNRLNTLLL